MNEESELTNEYEKIDIFEERQGNSNRYFIQLALFIIALYFAGAIILLMMNYELNVALFGIPLVLIGICIVVSLVLVQIFLERPPILSEHESIIEENNEF